MHYTEDFLSSPLQLALHCNQPITTALTKPQPMIQSLYNYICCLCYPPISKRKTHALSTPSCYYSQYSLANWNVTTDQSAWVAHLLTGMWLAFSTPSCHSNRPISMSCALSTHQSPTWTNIATGMTHDPVRRNKCIKGYTRLETGLPFL